MVSGNALCPWLVFQQGKAPGATQDSTWNGVSSRDGGLLGGQSRRDLKMIAECQYLETVACGEAAGGCSPVGR